MRAAIAPSASSNSAITAWTQAFPPWYITGEELQLFQDLELLGGMPLEYGQLLDAGQQIAGAIEQGADVLIVNRFGRQEREGKCFSLIWSSAH